MAVAELPLSPAVGIGAKAAAPAVDRQVRGYFLILFALGLAAFILGVENRFTRTGLFFLAVPVDLIPPLTAERWIEAFTLHRQDPVFTACGGSTSIEEFRLLYAWEWLRRLSVLLLGATALVGLASASVLPRFRFAWRRLAGLALIMLVYALARIGSGFLTANVDNLARFNVGQYRHAVDVTFVTLALAATLACAVAPPRRFGLPRRHTISRLGALWLGALVLDVAAGALYAARDAAAVATLWPGSFGRVVSYSPPWLNVVFNPDAIALIHHALSGALFVAALVWLAWSVRRAPAHANAALALVGLVTLQMVLGIMALAFGAPAILSILHRIGAVVLLAYAMVVFFASPLTGAHARTRGCGRAPDLGSARAA